MNDINIGDSVTIISSCQTKGRNGIVKEILYPYGNGLKYVSVDISKLGIRMYNAKSVKRKDGNIMNNLIKECNQVVGVKFMQGYNTTKEYTFALFEDEIKIGDMVLCDTTNGVSLGKVINIYDKDNVKTNVTKEIISVINTESFDKRQALKKKKNELQQKMDKRVKELQNITLYEMMAEKDNELALMLEQYKSLV